MEWYYTEWKLNLYNKFGLTQLRKILPHEKWFHKCVEAGKSQIFDDNPDLDISMLEIVYANSIEEALSK